MDRLNLTTKQNVDEIFSLPFQQVVFKDHTIRNGCSVSHPTWQKNRGWITILDKCRKQALPRLQTWLFEDYFLPVTSSGFHNIYMLSSKFFLQMELIFFVILYTWHAYWIVPFQEPDLCSAVFFSLQKDSMLTRSCLYQEVKVQNLY